MSTKRFVADLKKHQIVLAEERDALRALLASIEEVEGDTDEAIEALEQAIDCLSRLQ